METNENLKSETTSFSLKKIENQKNYVIDKDNIISFKYPTFESNEKLSSNRISLRIKGRQSIIEKKLILSTEMFYQPSLSDFTNDFRWRSNTRFEIPVSQSIAITSSVTYSYESITRLGRLPGDTALTFGFMVQLL